MIFDVLKATQQFGQYSVQKITIIQNQHKCNQCALFEKLMIKLELVKKIYFRTFAYSRQYPRVG